MVNIDFSKLLPARWHVYLSGFLPGLFFVLSILLANPIVATRFVASTKSMNLGNYMTVAITLFLAFVIGTAFVFVDTLIQFALSYLYRLKMWSYRLACKWPLRQICKWITTKPRWRKPWVARLQGRVLDIAQVGFVEPWKSQYHCWHILAHRLLELRYQLQPADLAKLTTDDFAVLLRTGIGKFKPEDLTGSPILIAVHATGWAGITAMLFAPALRNPYFATFCLFLIFNGILHAYYVAVRRFDPRFSGFLSVRVVLRALAENGHPETP